MTEPPDAGVAAFVRAALPPAPATVLEVGAGRGELAGLLRDEGWEVRAIDPAGHVAEVERLPLGELDVPEGSFDAAVAVVSLHHIEPLAPSLAVLAAAVRPGGTLVVDEIDIAALDERAATWWLARRAEVGEAEEHDAAALIAAMRGHVHVLARIREALAPAFELGEVERLPYLYRWHLPPGFYDAEAALVAAGELSAMGARFVGVRRTRAGSRRPRGPRPG